MLKATVLFALAVSSSHALSLRSDATSLVGRICCKAMIPQCLACAAGLSVTEYCAKNPGNFGCPKQKACCKALTAQCLSCSAGLTLDEYCQANPNVLGCPKKCPTTSISGRTCDNPNVYGSDCSVYFETDGDDLYACENNPKASAIALGANGTYQVIPGQFHCKRGPKCVGSKPINACCKALTAQCLSCGAGVTIEQYCATIDPFAAGCPAHPSYDKDQKQCMDGHTGEVLKLKECLQFDTVLYTCTDLSSSKNLPKNHCITWDEGIERCRSRINGRFVKSDACTGIDC